MPKIHDITCSLDDDKQVYKPGDKVSGCWIVDNGQSFNVKGIRVALHGVAFTRWNSSESKKGDRASKKNITTQWRTVFGNKPGENGPIHVKSAGAHKYRFSFKLPSDKLPSSYEGKYGAVRYWLTLLIERPLARYNINRVNAITVLDHIDINTPTFDKFIGRKIERKIKSPLEPGDQGAVTLTGETNRSAYCPGEKIAISVLAVNETGKDLGVIKASLLQRTKFVAADEEKTNEYVLRTITTASIQKRSRKLWIKKLLQLDAIPPTTRDNSCDTVMVSYLVKFTLDVPTALGGDLILTVPITIGTVPQGFQASAADNEHAEPTITYTQCKKGYEYFSERENDFPPIDYSPWCAYVPNFKFKNQPKPETPPKAPTASSESPQAPPLPAKSSLPPPSVVVPTPLPNSGYAYPEPSAPPIEIAPPSYEETMAGIAGIAPQTNIRR